MMEADTTVEIFATCSGDLAYDLTEVATNLGFWVASYRTSKLDFVQVKSASSFPKTGNLSLQQAYSLKIFNDIVYSFLLIWSRRHLLVG